MIHHDGVLSILINLIERKKMIHEKIIGRFKRIAEVALRNGYYKYENLYYNPEGAVWRV